jgi:hypothetical protein
MKSSIKKEVKHRKESAVPSLEKKQNLRYSCYAPTPGT